MNGKRAFFVGNISWEVQKGSFVANSVEKSFIFLVYRMKRMLRDPQFVEGTQKAGKGSARTSGKEASGGSGYYLVVKVWVSWVRCVVYGI